MTKRLKFGLFTRAGGTRLEDFILAPDCCLRIPSSGFLPAFGFAQ
jgi:hypothetical protein